jgi:tRNA (cytosine34-C5)-methyltransferase
VVQDLAKPVPWLKHGWEINCDSSTLSSDISLTSLHSFLMREISLGNIVRQELVSMIPVEVLGVQQGHSVLDMCAAPGSKTEQIIGYVTGQSSITSCSGMVVANDVDCKRIQILSKRYERCHCPQLVLTCATSSDLTARIRDRVFDRILCDVPCTGDGTFRKLPYLWRKFRPRFGVEIHPLQLRIAKDAVSMLKFGGRMVYSTCSLNPIENEAVVASLLLWAKKKHLNLRLVDPLDDSVACKIEGLKWRPGLSHWESSEEVMLLGELDQSELARSKQRLPKIVSTMHPPSDEAVARSLHLDRCMRIMPQDQNTGGFFVAVLELMNPHSDAKSTDNLHVKSKRKIEKEAQSDVYASKKRQVTPETDTESNQK